MLALDLPPILREDFNRIAKTIPGAVCWVSDEANPGVVDPNEIASCRPNQGKLAGYEIDGLFTDKFRKLYKRVGEFYRRELVKKELARSTLVTIVTNLNDYRLTPAQKQMLSDILAAGQEMEEAYQRERGAWAFKREVETRGTREDQEFYRRYQSIWCYDRSNPYCTAIPSIPQFSTPLYPDGINCEKDIVGDDLTNPFSVVRQDVTQKFRAIPFAEDPELKYIQAQAAAKLRKAAQSARNADEGTLAQYMEAVADAFLTKKPFPYVKADEAWVASKGSKFFLRIGPDEVQEDSHCQMRAQFHMTLAIKDPSADNAMQEVIKHKQTFEEYLARLVPNYKPREINLETPEFMNVIMEYGDSRGGVKGTAAAQTLPNWCGEDGKADCKTRAMMYQNKTTKGYSQQLLASFAQIFSQNVVSYLSPESIADKMVYHEIAHNLGPQMKEYRESLGDMYTRLEELKAEIGAQALLPVLEETGLAKKEKRNSWYAGLLAWSIGHIRRGSYRGENYFQTQSPYQQLAAVIVGHFTERGAFTYNNGIWDINYEKCPEAAASLYSEVGKLYLKANRQAVADFFMKYTSGNGLASLHLDRINETVAKVPVTLFDYRVVGLGRRNQRGVVRPTLAAESLSTRFR